MKYVLFLLSLLFFVSCKHADAAQNDKEPSYTPLETSAEVAPVKINLTNIDSFRTNREVEVFVHAVDTNYRELKFYPLDQVYADTVGALMIKSVGSKLDINKNFYTTDFDNNGYTDMLLLGAWVGSYIKYKDIGNYSYDPLVIMNYGDKPPKIMNIDWRGTLPFIKSENRTTYLERHGILEDYDLSGKKQKIARDSVAMYKWVKFNFAGYHPAPKNYKIEKIEFYSGPCFGSCPMFQIIINKDKSALLLAVQHNFINRSNYLPDGTAYKANLDDENYEKLFYYLNYIDFPSLENNYSVTGSDRPKANLVITYDGGRIKKYPTTVFKVHMS